MLVSSSLNVVDCEKRDSLFLTTSTFVFPLRVVVDGHNLVLQPGRNLVESQSFRDSIPVSLLIRPALFRSALLVIRPPLSVVLILFFSCFHFVCLLAGAGEVVSFHPCPPLGGIDCALASGLGGPEPVAALNLKSMLAQGTKQVKPPLRLVGTVVRACS